jgi:hypothetical protein
MDIVNVQSMIIDGNLKFLTILLYIITCGFFPYFINILILFIYFIYNIISFYISTNIHTSNCKTLYFTQLILVHIKKSNIISK